MMIDKRLIRTVGESRKYIVWNVVLQWCALLSNAGMIYGICRLLTRVLEGRWETRDCVFAGAAVLAAAAVRYACQTGAAKMSFLSSRAAKKTLRSMLYQKVLSLGMGYEKDMATSEIVQVSVEGVDQLETYFGAYLPQFFYALLAPVTLFVLVCFINVPAAIVLLLCVPLIPAAIAAVQTWAKKLLGKYWGEYTALGDTFLENLQGLTTLKLYQADGFKNQEMNEQAERFRRITMKVLTMQLNSITIMDLIAYGGAAVGMIVAVCQLRAGAVGVNGALMILLLAADFFLPMRQLGSFFHIAMNGMAASEKIFRILDLPETETRREPFPKEATIVCQGLSFSYEPGGRQVLKDVNLTVPAGGFVAIAGESGCGKSTLAAVLMGKHRDYAGVITIGGVSLEEISDQALLKNITYVGHQGYLFRGTVRDNLQMGNPEAGDDVLWHVLEQVQLAQFLRQQDGLETVLQERGSNFSGGQCQRLALARAILHNSPIYIFDEATSNIDVESEDMILKQILQLAQDHTVVMISHRLANAVKADRICVMDGGAVAEQGSHEELLGRNGLYGKLWRTQQELENYTGKEGAEG